MGLDLLSLPRVTITIATVLAALSARAQDKPVTQGWEFGPGPRVSRSGFELHLSGYVQEDFRSFHDYEDANGIPPVLDETAELRRFRVGLEGEYKRFSFEVDFELHDRLEHLKNAFGEIKVSKALHVRGGNFKVPVSGEWLTSAAKTDFVERSLLASAIAPGRDWGVALSGQPGRLLNYEVGVFKGDGRSEESRADTTVAARFELSPFKTVDLAVSGSQGEVKADDNAAVTPLPRGVPVRPPSGFRLYERHFVNGTRRRLGADARFHHGPIGVKAEVLRMTQERRGQGSVFDDLPTEVMLGWSASATWLVTGDRKVRTIKPQRPIHRGGAGAIELGVRYDSLTVDDDGPDTGFAASGNRARNIRPVGGKTLTGGLSWWPVEFARLVGNVVAERYDDPLLAPVPGRQGNYLTLLGRLQLHVP